MVAGEASGDTLGEGLIQSLKSRYPNATFVGIGGSKMISQGLNSWYPMEKLSVMGIFEVLKHLPELLKLRKDLIKQLLQLKPDVFIGIDAPDFNFTVERKLKEAGIKTVHYVGPSVWAWREKRLEKIQKCVDGMLVLFPFEPPFYEKYQIPVAFVGHPLANEVPQVPDRQQAQIDLKINAGAEPVVGLLPGSRMSEITKMAPLYLKAAKKLIQDYPDIHFAIPCIHQQAYDFIDDLVVKEGLDNRVSLYHKQAQKVMEASHFLVVTSGTASLEAALMKRPMIISIQVHPFSYWLMKKLATTQWIGLPNILAQKELVTELIQEDATEETITLALNKLISDKKMQQQQLEAFEKQYQQLKQNASEKAANSVIEWAELSRHAKSV